MIQQSIEKGVLKNKMPALVISMLNDHTSTVATRRLLQSITNTDSQVFPFIINATIPATLNKDLAVYKKTLNNWTYPKSPAETRIDIKTGLTISGYNAKDYTKVVSCLVSHMKCWDIVRTLDMPMMVLEHDALFVRRFASTPSAWVKHGIVGLNDPRGATRKGSVFLERVINSKKANGTEFLLCPWVDDNQSAPQGIAGNSAYVINPKMANKLFDKIDEIGLWPNDAIMCKQFFPTLKVVYPFFTTIQGIKSTTQG